MAKPQKRDSQQENAVTNSPKARMYEALKKHNRGHNRIQAEKLLPGMWIVTHVGRDGRAAEALEIRELEWSRRGEWCKVYTTDNKQLVYSWGGYADVLGGSQTDEDEATALLAELFPEFA
jgi:hypothetical protein